MDEHERSTLRITVGSAANAKEYRVVHGLGWCYVEHNTSVTPLTVRPIASLPLLEVELAEVLRQVAGMGGSTEQACDFPFLLVVDAAVAEGHEYWVARAVDWVRDASAASLPWAGTGIQKLSSAMESGRYSQAIRHKVRRLLSAVGASAKK